MKVEHPGLGVPSGELYKGIASSLKRIWVEEGLRGLYRGLGPVMVGYLPTWYCSPFPLVPAFVVSWRGGAWWTLMLLLCF